MSLYICSCINADVSPVTAGPFIEERFYAIHHLLTALTGRDVQVYVGGDGLPVLGRGDVQVHVPVPHVTVSNHARSTLAFQSFLIGFR